MVDKDSLSAKTKSFRKHKLGAPEKTQGSDSTLDQSRTWRGTGKELAENE